MKTDINSFTPRHFTAEETTQKILTQLSVTNLLKVLVFARTLLEIEQDAAASVK